MKYDRHDDTGAAVTSERCADGRGIITKAKNEDGLAEDVC